MMWVTEPPLKCVDGSLTRSLSVWLLLTPTSTLFLISFASSGEGDAAVHLCHDGNIPHMALTAPDELTFLQPSIQNLAITRMLFTIAVNILKTISPKLVLRHFL